MGRTESDSLNGKNVNRLWPGVALLMLLAAGLRLYLLGGKSLWADEVFLVNGANRPLTEILSYFLIGDLVSVLSTKAIIAVAGVSETVLRLPSAIAGTAAVGALYYSLRRDLGQKTALLAAALLAVSFPHIYYSQEARSFAALTIWSALSLKATWDLNREGDTKSAALWSLWMLLGINSHFFSVALFGYELLYLWLAAMYGGNFKERLKTLGSVTLIFTLAVSGSILLFNQMVPSAEEVHLRMPVGEVFGARIWLLQGQFLSGAGKAAWLFGLVTLIGLMAGVRGKRLFFAGLLTVPFCLVAFAAWYRHVGHALRYDLFLLPALIALMAEGMTLLGKGLSRALCTKNLRGARITAIAVIAVVLAGFAVANLGAYREYLAFPAKYNWPVDWKDAAGWLKQNVTTDDAVLLDPSGITLLSLPSLYRYYAEHPGKPPLYISGGDYRPVLEVQPHSYPSDRLEVLPLETWTADDFTGDIYILLTFVDISVFDKLDWLRWWEPGYISRIEQAQMKFEMLLGRTAPVKTYFGLSIIKVPFAGKEKLDSLINLTILPAYHRSLPSI